MTSVLEDKVALARLVPHLVPPTFAVPDDESELARSRGPWVQRPRATTGGAGDHALATPAGAEWSGAWVVQERVDADERVECVVQLTSLDPLELHVQEPGPAADALVEALVAAWGLVAPARYVADVAIAGGRPLVVEVEAGEALEDGDGWAEVIVAVSTAPVPIESTSWDLDPELAVHVGGELRVLEPADGFVCLANADGLGRDEIMAELPSLTLSRTAAVLRDHEPRPEVPFDVDGVVVERDGDRWCVRGRWAAPRWVPTEHQVPMLARRAELLAVVATEVRPALTGTALAVQTNDAAAVVLGPPTFRRAIAEAWLELGGAVVADELVVLDDGRALPRLDGVATRLHEQWIEGTPRPGTPLVAPDGTFVEVWQAPAGPAAPVPIGVVVLPGARGTDLLGVRRADALRALLAHRAPGRRDVTVADAAALVALSAVTTVTAPTDNRAGVADALRALLSAAYRP
jgi:hypothetical protein